MWYIDCDIWFFCELQLVPDMLWIVLTLLNGGGSNKILCSYFATEIVFIFAPNELPLQFFGCSGIKSRFWHIYVFLFTLLSNFTLKNTSWVNSRGNKSRVKESLCPGCVAINCYVLFFVVAWWWASDGWPRRWGRCLYWPTSPNQGRIWSRGQQSSVCLN